MSKKDGGGNSPSLTGQRFGRLTIVDHNYRIDGCTRKYFRCRCDCGVETVVRASHVRQGKTQSCGCYSRELAGELGRQRKGCSPSNKLPKGEAQFNTTVRVYQRAAQERNLIWGLDREYCRTLFQQQCAYCGKGPSNSTKPSPRGNGEYVYNGIDRIDNLLGYVSGNVTTCCRTCNIAKQTMTVSEFKEWIKRVYENLYVTEKKSVEGTPSTGVVD